MAQTFGIALPGKHSHAPYRAPARYLVIIEAAGSMVARLLSASGDQVAEFDAGTEEVAAMTLGLLPATGAEAAQWNRALEGHNTAERVAALVYTLDV